MEVYAFVATDGWVVKYDKENEKNLLLSFLNSQSKELRNEKQGEN